MVRASVIAMRGNLNTGDLDPSTIDFGLNSLTSVLAVSVCDSTEPVTLSTRPPGRSTVIPNGHWSEIRRASWLNPPYSSCTPRISRRSWRGMIPRMYLNVSFSSPEGPFSDSIIEKCMTYGR